MAVTLSEGCPAPHTIDIDTILPQSGECRMSYKRKAAGIIRHILNRNLGDEKGGR